MNKGPGLPFQSLKFEHWQYWKCSYTVSEYQISFVPCFICFYVSPIPLLICPMYHLFRVSSVRVSSSLRPIWSASDLFCVSPVPRLTCSASHLFCVPPVPRHTLRLICSISQIFRVSKFRQFPHSQILSQLQTTSQNQSCLTRVEM